MNPQTHKLFLLNGLLGTVPSVRPSTAGFHRRCDRHSRELFVLCGNSLLHHLQADVPNVDGCVMVPVVVSTTAGASPLPIGKGKFLIQCATYMAHLAGWKPLIDFCEDLSAIPEFILQHLRNIPKPLSLVDLPSFREPAIPRRLISSTKTALYHLAIAALSSWQKFLR